MKIFLITFWSQGSKWNEEGVRLFVLPSNYVEFIDLKEKHRFQRNEAWKISFNKNDLFTAAEKSTNVLIELSKVTVTIFVSLRHYLDIFKNPIRNENNC